MGPLEAGLTAAGIQREPLVDRGLSYVRRTSDTGSFYFVANRTSTAVEGWIPFATAAGTAVVMDPMTGETGIAASRNGTVYLQMPAGSSLIVRFDNEASGRHWSYRTEAGTATSLKGTWRVRFISGGPELPQPYETRELTSWTGHGAPAERFAGTAVYSLTFDRPPGTANQWILDLGSVKETARVRVNGRSAGTLLGPDYSVFVGTLKPRGNKLEVEVTSLSANRIRDLDIRGVEWKTFHDTNIVNINYRPLDASKWDVLPAGLLGPVTLRSSRELVVESR